MTGNPSLDKVLIALNGAIVALSTALILYSHLVIKPPEVDEGLQMQGLLNSSINLSQITPVKFPELLLNLYSKQTRLRFLQLQMNLEVFNEKDKQIVETYKAFITDSLIDITGNLSPAELNSVTGRILLETRIKNRVNEQLKKKVIKKIYFSKFIIQ